MMSRSSKEKLIVALDVESAEEAREVVASLGDRVGMFKVGMQLFTSAGPQIVREIVSAGSRVFLDLKFHDIPNTVAAASREAVRLGVSIFNLHASGGGEMMRRAVEATHETAAREALARPQLIAVTALTSADASTLEEVGIDASPAGHVRRLARLAEASGADGVVASPHEIRDLRACIPREEFLIVTPGVRPPAVAHDDQKRVMTPAEAIRAGASYIVMGRAVLNAPDRQRAVAEIIEEMEKASER
jgi:orotidine-5'-phosphate decarboxylase